MHYNIFYTQSLEQDYPKFSMFEVYRMAGWLAGWMMVSFDQSLLWCALALRNCSLPAFLFSFSSPRFGAKISFSLAFATFEGQVDVVTIIRLMVNHTNSPVSLSFLVLPQEGGPPLPRVLPGPASS